MRWSSLYFAMVVVLAGGACEHDEELSAPQAALMEKVAEGVLSADGKAPNHVELAGTFVDQLVSGQYAVAVSRFDPAMLDALPPDRLEAVWKQVEAEAGAFEQRRSIRLERMGEFVVALVHCRFAKEDRIVRVVFRGRQVAGLFFAALPAAGVERRGEQLVDLLASGRFDQAFAQFDAQMKQALPADKLRLAWKSVVEKNGPFRKRIGTQATRQGGYDIALVSCQFEKRKVTAKVVFDGDQVSGLFFFPDKGQNEHPWQKPDYVDLKFFRDHEVTVVSGTWKLPGTLSLPNGDGPFPGLVLVHGSGPQDRDETVGPNKPFRDLAWGLATRGVAALRYEKRTKVHGNRMAELESDITTEVETVRDAALAVDLLRKTERVDPSRVFVLGHSLGGKLIPRIANVTKDAAGYVVLAGSSRPLEDLILEQTEYIMGLDGGLSEVEHKELAKVRDRVKRVKSKGLRVDTPRDQLPLNIPAAYWLDLRGYRPAEAARAIDKPLLVLQGARDYQVTTEDFEGWKKTLAGKKNVIFKLYPKLNHLFMTGEGKSEPQEYDRLGHVAKRVVEDLAAWVKNGKLL